VDDEGSHDATGSVLGVAIVLKKWLRKNRLPDAIVIEHPRRAGGHLGTAKPEAMLFRGAGPLPFGAAIRTVREGVELVIGAPVSEPATRAAPGS
jgi:NAD(P)H-dependent flavin oxidoreductase YrpB (nitropropane dioxygenase family)